MLPIKEIRLKMFQHERQPLKPTSGLLSPLSMRANPMAWQCRPAGEEKQSHALLEWNLVSIRAHHQHREITVMMCMTSSLVYHCTALAEELQILTELQMVFPSFLFFCWHSVLTRVHRGQVCLLLSLYEIESCWRCQSDGLEKLVWLLLLSWV